MKLKPLSDEDRDKTKKLLWAAVVVVALIASFMMVSDRLFFIFGFDTPNYILLAKSIALGHGYSDINVPGIPSQTQYPPGLPLLLAPVIYLFGYNLMWIRLIIIFFGVLSIYATKRVFESEGYKFMGIIIALLTLGNFYFISFTREILSEVPYMFFSLLAIFFFDKYYADNSRRAYLRLFAVMLVVSYFTKMIGVTLYAAVLAALASRGFKEKWRGNLPLKKFVIFAVLAITPFLLLMLRNTLLSSGGNTYQSIFFNANYYNADSGYANLFSLFARIKGNLGIYLLLPSRMLFVYPGLGGISSIILNVLYYIIFALILYGILHELYRARGIKEFYVIFYLSLVIAWPVYGIGDSFRYLVPLIPFFYYYLFVGVRLTAGKITGLFCNITFSSGKLMALVCCILLAFDLLGQRELLLSSSISDRIHESTVILRKDIFKKYDTVSAGVVLKPGMTAIYPCMVRYIYSSYFLKSILRHGEVATTRKPWLTALITGGYVLKYPFTNNPEKMLQFFIREKIDYVIVDGCYQETRNYIIPFIRKYRKRFETTNDKYPVFKFNRP